MSSVPGWPSVAGRGQDYQDNTQAEVMKSAPTALDVADGRAMARLGFRRL
jgi:hypothetical protein